MFSQVLEKHNRPINESEIMTLILSDDMKANVMSKLKDTLGNTVLRERHSKKLGKLLKLLDFNGSDLDRPRVNPSTGHIFDKYKRQSKSIPASILGYCDWLYSRRNAIVHGGGNNQLSENDFHQLKKLYKVEPARRVRLSLPSVKNANNFYKDLLCEILQH